MGRIYCITNTINNKMYVGKTMGSIEKRFSRHKTDSRKRLLEKRPLYSAMRKYGTEKFTIRELEEVEDEFLDDREIYWIDKLNTYKNGYNATKGGEGRSRGKSDKSEIERLIKLGYTSEEISNKIGCCLGTVWKTGKRAGIKIRNRRSKMVGQFNKITGELIKTHITASDAGQYLLDAGLIKNKNITAEQLSKSIRKCCVGISKSAYGFIWKYLPEPTL